MRKHPRSLDFKYGVLSRGSSLPSMTSSCAQENWVGSWSTSPVEFSIQKFFGNHFKDFGLHHLTFRTVIKPTLAGETVRLTFSNTYGTGPMTIDAVTIAKTISKHWATGSVSARIAGWSCY